MAPLFVGSNSDDSRIRSDRVSLAASTSNPASAVTGDVYYNSTDNKLTAYNGSDWASAGGGGTAEFTASGTLSNGQTVVITSDGKVAGVSTSQVTQSVGTAVVADNAQTNNIAVSYDSSSEKIVIAYKDLDDSNYGKAVVGTVSGSTITFGSPVTFASASTNEINSVYDPSNEKVVIVFQDTANVSRGKAIVGAVSGTSISFDGSETTFETGNTSLISSTFDSSNNKVVISYKDNDDSGKGKAVVGTVSGSSISFGTPTTFHDAGTDSNVVVYDSNAQKIVIFYQDIPAGAGYIANCVVGTVSGTSISYGSEVSVTSNRWVPYSGTYDASQQVVLVVYRDITDSNKSKVIAGSISDTSISFGSAVAYTPNQSVPISITHHTAAGKNIISFRDGSGTNGRFTIATASGTTLTVGGETDFESGDTQRIHSTYDSVNKKVIIAYRDDDNSDRTTAIAINPAFTDTNLTSTNFIGFSDAAYSDGATATVQIEGSVDDAQSGLTTARKHYVQTDGTLSTTAGNPSVVAGTAISGTKIIIET